MSKIQYNVKYDADKTILSLNGQIDESFPPDLHALEVKGTLQIDLDGVKMINSLGIREWIKFMTAVSKNPLEFYNCPKIFIDQVNMVQGFIPNMMAIKSFYVPYFNEDENVEKNILFSFGKEFGNGPLSVPGSITADGVELELDVVEQKYFKFLKG